MQEYTDALSEFRWVAIHEAAKKEASRQIGLMNRWLKKAEETDDEELVSAPWDIADAIKKAGKYQYKIYNRNKEIKVIDARLKSLAEEAKNPNSNLVELKAEADGLVAEKSELESEQLTLSMRILRIFCAVHGTVTLSKGAA